MPEFPTCATMFTSCRASLDDANAALSTARDWLKSDWTPVGSSLTDRPRLTAARHR